MILLRPTCGADRKMYSAARCCNSWSSAVACELRMSVTCGAISVYVCASCNVATAAVTAGAAEDAARGGASHLDVRVKQEGARVSLCHLELRVQRLQNNNNKIRLSSVHRATGKKAGACNCSWAPQPGVSAIT